jgi:uncharacterized protein
VSLFYQWEGDTLLLNVKVRARAKRDAIGKVVGDKLAIHVAAVPEQGKATAHLVEFLAGEFQVPRSSVCVVSGVHNPNKRLRILAPRRLPPVVPARSC